MDEKKSTREKLIELLKKWEINSPHFYHEESIADLLIESGLIVEDNKLLVCSNCGIESVYNCCPRCGCKLKE